VVAFPLLPWAHRDNQQFSTISCRSLHLVNSFASRSFSAESVVAPLWHSFFGANISNYWCYFCKFTAYQSSVVVFCNISVSPFWMFAPFFVFCWSFSPPLRGIVWDFWLSFAGIYCSLISALFFETVILYGIFVLVARRWYFAFLFVDVFFPRYFFGVFLPSRTLMLLCHSLFWQPSGASDLSPVFPGAKLSRGETTAISCSRISVLPLRLMQEFDVFCSKFTNDFP